MGKIYVIGIGPGSERDLTIGARDILGKHDDVPESYFLNVGSIDEVRAKMQ